MGINTTNSTPCNPQGSGQCGRLIGTVWSTIKLYAHSHGLDVSEWEEFLSKAIMSGRKRKVMASHLLNAEEQSGHPLSTKDSKQTTMDPTDILAR